MIEGENEADEPGEKFDINVTPFIDVMLVLLIIFMVAAPLATVDVPVELPSSDASRAPEPYEPLYLSVGLDGSWKVGEVLVQAGGLKEALDRVSHQDTAKPIYVQADKHLPYEDLMRVMDGLAAAGYSRVSLIGLGEGRQ